MVPRTLEKGTGLESKTTTHAPRSSTRLLPAGYDCP
jgi:hypothetical protein